MNFLDIFVAIIPVFLIVGVGGLTRWFGIVTDESEKSILRIVINILYPCFILSKVPGNVSLQDPSLVAIALAAGFCLTLIGLGISWGTGAVLKIGPDDGRGTFCLSSAIQNYGFIPIPLIIALFPDTANETLGVLFVHNLGLEIAIWTVGIIILSGTIKGSIRRLLNGPTIAIAIGLLLNFTGIYVYIPSVVSSAMTDLGNCVIPVSLLLVGASLTGVIIRERWKTQWRVIGGSVFVRFLVMPTFFLLAASLVPFSPELKRILIIESAMPAAIFPIVLAKHYGGRPGIAVQVCIATSVVSLALTPLILMFGLRLFEMPGR